MKSLRLLTKRFFIVLHLVIVALFVLACMAPWVNPSGFWPLAFLGLAFPVLLFFVFFFIPFWLLFDPKFCLISLAALLISLRTILSTFAWHIPSSNPVHHPAGNLTVLTYNMHGLQPYDNRTDKKHLFRDSMFSVMRSLHPDIACLEEFHTTAKPGGDFADLISRTMGLPYRYFSGEFNRGEFTGTALFSRFPVIDSGRIALPGRENGENALYADLVAGSDTFRVFTMHLQSIRLDRQDLEGIEKIKHDQDSGLAASRPVLSKIRRAFIKRGFQADQMAGSIASSPYPAIVCGDFNDTPGSYVYFKVRGRLQDAFLKKGWGIGRTYMGISPTLRIDYILADPRFQVNYFVRVPRALSDHYPIAAGLSLRR